MLKRLVISNYALIDNLEISLNGGLTIITGETGAGKSIILGALTLLLGERADVRSVRNSDKKTVVEGVFDISGYSIESFLSENDVDSYNSDCILRRELLPNGRSRAFVNDTPVTVSVLSELASRLIDIHSQHSNALLLNPVYQLDVIDGISTDKELRLKYAQIYDEYFDLKKRIEETKSRIEKNKADEEYFRFQLRQFDSVELDQDVINEMEKRRSTLENISEIKERLWNSSSILGNDDNSIVSGLSYLRQQLDGLIGIFDEAAAISQRVDSLYIESKDILDTLNGYVDNLNDDPDELEQINEKLSAVYSLQQRYHVKDVADLVKIKNDLEKALFEIDNSEEEISELQKKLGLISAKLEDAANKLTAERKSVAGQFSEKLVAVAKPLGMKNLACKIEFLKIDYAKNGQDKIRFLFSFNKNQALMPVEKTASGGEISRLMLCLKSIIVEKMQLPSIIFDEIDTGVSGDIANKIGNMMKSISKKIQVIAITHLPQVAALGDYHYKVYKQDIGNLTVTNMAELNKIERINEIAGMLSGAQINAAAMDNAKSLLNYDE